MIENAFVLFLLFLTTYFMVFLVVTFLEERKTLAISPTTPLLSFPTVTIIIPAWNEEKTLAGTVNSLLDLDYPKDRIQLFIVDDGSTDNTLAIAKEFERHANVRVFHKENGGKCTAMNLGISESTADLVGCLDADSFVEKNALIEIVRYLEDPEVMAVTPAVLIHAPDNPLRRMQSTEYIVGQFTRKIFARLNALYVTPGPFSIYRREVFTKIGPFVHGYGTEDMEMAMRMQANHMRIENAHTARIYTVCPRTPRTLYKQRVRWITGFLKNVFFHYRYLLFSPRFGNLGMLTIPFAFGSIFIALIFALLGIISLWAFIRDAYLQFTSVGLHPEFGWPHFDWFAISLDLKMILVYILGMTTVSFVYLGMRLAREGSFFSQNTLWFLALYGLIAPFWLARSLYNLITSKEARWR